MTSSVTDSINKLKGSYGGSEKSSASFLRPEYVLYNSPSKAKDLGSVDNLNTTITGTIGSEVGANTLYFKVVTNGESDLRILKNELSKHENKYISIGLLDENKKSLSLTTEGFGYQNEILNTKLQEGLLQLPPASYFFTVSSSQWQALPFSVNIQVIRYVLLDGIALGINETTGRIGLVKLFGDAIGRTENSLTFVPKNIIKALSGSTQGNDQSYAQLIINSQGVALGQMAPYGRLKMYWKLTGTATGTNENVATLTSTPPYGGYP